MENPSDILKRYWGYDQFRPLQADIIHSVLAGHDTLALLPTGGGKSVCFQVPGLCLGGLTLVISPLIALMQDQVNRLEQMGIPAAFVNATLPHWQIDARLQAAMDGDLRFLYLAPERLQSEMFQARVRNMPINLLAIDEAHCVSQWGHDFRPSYLEIHTLRDIFPKVPMLALTASAPPSVKADIVQQLRLRQPAEFLGSFRRPNLRFFVLPEENTNDRLLRIATRTQGTGIVYARTRRHTEEVARLLQSGGFSAAAYHAGLPNTDRSRIQQSWINNEVRFMAATNAFGMGIDKGEVRLVVHYHLPADLESYYQEAGRAGRDGEESMAVSFLNPIDLRNLRDWSELKYPDWPTLQGHYHFLCQHFRVSNEGVPPGEFVVDLSRLAQAGKTSALSLFNSIRILDREGFIAFNESPDDFGYLMLRMEARNLLNYKERTPAYAPLIDFVLRQLGGEVYHHEAAFLPYTWAQDLRLTPDELDQKLNFLIQQGVLIYRPPLKEPTLRFLKPYQFLTKAALNWERYEWLKQRNTYRLNEMIRYVEQTEICRSLFLQHYFGENATDPCGVCDICTARKNRRVERDLFEEIKNQMLEMVRQEKPTYRDLMLGEPGDAVERERVLRFLVEKEWLKIDPFGVVQLRKNGS